MTCSNECSRCLEHEDNGGQCEKEWDEVGFIMAYEGGEVSDDEIIEGFQHLIDNSHAWSLQGSYGRTAQALIDAGYCTAKT